MDFVQLRERPAVEQFHDGRLDPGPAHGEDTRCGALEVGVEGGDGVHLLRQVLQPHGDAHHNPQRSLGADKQPGQVIARHALEGLVAGVDQRAVGQDDVQGQHRVPGDPVLGTAQTAGVGSHVPADGGTPEACRVRRVHQPVGGRGLIKLGVDDPGFHYCGLIVGVQVQDPVQPFQGEDHAAARGMGAAGHTRPRSAGHQRHIRGGAGTHHRLDVRYRRREHHGHGKLEVQDGRLVHRVPPQGPFGGVHLSCPDGSHQFLNHAFHKASIRVARLHPV